MHTAPFAAACSLFTGLAYLSYSVLFFYDPCHRSRSAHEFMTIYDREPRFYLWRARVLGAGSVLALGMLPAISRLAGGGDLVYWASIVAGVGFAANALSNLRTLQILPVVYTDWRGAGEDAKTALARSTSYLSLDPRGWFTFGGVGVWLIVADAEATSHGSMPLWLAIVGIALGAALVVVVPAGVLHRYAAFSAVAATAGLILAPVWFIAIGVNLA